MIGGDFSNSDILLKTLSAYLQKKSNVTQSSNNANHKLIPRSLAKQEEENNQGINFSSNKRTGGGK
jgi:hypothetical protein